MSQQLQVEESRPSEQAISQDEVSIWIDAPPEEVYGLISDVTRIGEFSPECYRCEWLDGAAGPAIGARFRGYNRFRGFRWSRTAKVLRADPGREFVFQTEPNGPYQDSNIWRFQFIPKDNGTYMIQSYETTYSAPWMRLFEYFLSRKTVMGQGMQSTLERIKATVEQQHH